MIRSVHLWLIVGLCATAWLVSPQQGSAMTSGKPAPEITGEQWLNSKPLSIAGLKGRVVLVEFWTYG